MLPQRKPAMRIGFQPVPVPLNPKKPLNTTKSKKAPTPKVKLVKAPFLSRPQYSSECLDPEVREWVVFGNRPVMRTRGRTRLLAAAADAEDGTDFKFTLFPKLPLELRRLIWTQATNIQRQVAVYKYNLEYVSEIDSGPLLTPCVPVLLQTCHESREIALKTYESIKCKDSSFNDGSQPGPLYFNFAQDIYVNSIMTPQYDLNDPEAHCSVSRLLPQSFFTRVRHMAITSWDFWRLTGFASHGQHVGNWKEEYYQSMKKNCAALESLYIIDCYEKSKRGPAELPLLSDVTELVINSEAAPMSSRNPYDVMTCIGEDIKAIQQAYPEWKAPVVRYVRVGWKMGVSSDIKK